MKVIVTSIGYACVDDVSGLTPVDNPYILLNVIPTIPDGLLPMGCRSSPRFKQGEYEVDCTYKTKWNLNKLVTDIELSQSDTGN